MTLLQPGLDDDTRYRAVHSRDPRFDGVFYTAVSSTGIYCRPSCPARTPARHNVTFHPTAASAQAAGYRACKRCRPDATPGSPDWDVAADLAGRAMRLIADGVVDRDGVSGLADRLGYTPRHLSRLLTQQLGAGPLALARARRAQIAHVLLSSTALTHADIAFAAGFSSIRQFNATVKEVYAATPTQLRGARRSSQDGGGLTLRLAVRTPYAGRRLHAFLARRALPGIEVVGERTYARTLRLPHGHGTVRLTLEDLPDVGLGFIEASFVLSDLRDTIAAIERTRRLLDADCDPVTVGRQLSQDPLLGRLVSRMPGLRVPGHVDGHEVAVRAVLGQQVSVAQAQKLAGDLIHRHGDPIESGIDGLTHLFPTAEVIAAIDPLGQPMPRARGRALASLSGLLAERPTLLERSTDRCEVRQALLAVPGIGPWTADYIALRALGDPDVFLPTDAGTKQALRLLGVDPTHAADLARSWAPWRSYAQLTLWESLCGP